MDAPNLKFWRFFQENEVYGSNQLYGYARKQGK